MRLLSSILCITALTGASTFALVISGPNGTGAGNTTQGPLITYLAGAGTPVFPYYNNVIQVSDASGTYLGANGDFGWVMTAGHVSPLGVGSSTITVGSTTYTVRDSVLIGTSDLRLYRIGGETGDPALPLLPNVLLSTTSPGAGTGLLDFGRGIRVEGTANSATNSDIAQAPGTNNSYYEWGSASAMRWGTNSTVLLPPWLGPPVPNATVNAGGFTTNVIYSVFDDVGSGNYLNATEAHFAVGDSGGPAFGLDGSNWVLTGWNLYTIVDPPNNATQPGATSGFGNMAFYGNVQDVQSAMVAAMVPEPNVAVLSLLCLLGLGRRR